MSGGAWMLALLMPLLVVALGAGPVQFSGTASMYSEYGWVTGDGPVEPRPGLRLGRAVQLPEEVA